eukprot:scaffold221957_cov15-Prasinocladus_malaysianus.AAC.1
MNSSGMDHAVLSTARPQMMHPCINLYIYRGFTFGSVARYVSLAAKRFAKLMVLSIEGMKH